MNRGGVRSARLWVAMLALTATVQAASCGGQSEGKGRGGDETAGGGSKAGALGTSGATARGGSAARGGTGGGARGGSGASGAVAGGGTAAGGAPDGGFAGDQPAGSGGSGTGGASGAGGVAEPPAPGVCERPRRVSANLEGCDAAGFVHRETAAACEPPLRDAEWVPELPPGAGVEDLPQCTRVEYAECRLVLNDCTRDADCPGSALCLREARMSDDGLELHISHYCHSPCRADADCSTDEICVCDPRTQNATLADVEVGACVPATCKTDADCSDATEQRFCISPFTHGRLRRESTPAGTTDYRFYCQTPNDECHGPETCTIETGPIDCCPAAICEYDVDRFQCRTVDMCTLCSLDAG